MLPSFHDHALVGYEVACEARTISLHTRHPIGASTSIIAFSGVEGYDFENDAFGNIIFSLESVPVENILEQFREQIAESYRMAGSPGPWAADLSSAPAKLTARGVRGFLLSSSYGISGWVLAKHVQVVGA